MISLRTIVLGLAACALASPAVAQQRGSTANIVVTGRPDADQPPPTQEEVSRQARRITQGGDFRHSPLARFEGSLCPGIMGLAPEYASLMIDRIRDQAAVLGISLADDTDCTPNLIIALVDDGKAELNALDKANPMLFHQLDTVERRALLAENGPVHVWTTTRMETRDGTPISRDATNERPGDLMSSAPLAEMWMAHSKIYLPIQRNINQVVVLYDREAVKGKTLSQLADYAIIRGLARTKPLEEGQAMDSILTLFDPDASPPLYLTAFDKAYLASLYDSIPNLPGTAKIGGVSHQLQLQAAAEAKE